MRLSLRLNDRKDAALINILTNVPDKERSATTRVALYKFFGIPLRELIEPPIELTAQVTQIPKEVKQVPMQIPKETDSEGKLDQLLRQFG